MRSKMTKALILTLLAVIGLVGLMSGLGCAIGDDLWAINLGPNQLKKFTSYDDLEEYVKDKRLNNSPYFYWHGGRGSINIFTMESLSDSKSGGESIDWSSTNIQVEGVDEADIVKTDGTYIYLISGDKLIIVEAYPVEEAQVLSEIALEYSPIELFINGDRLVVFEQDYQGSYTGDKVYVKTYDVSDRESPVLVRNVTMDGSYHASRMIGQYTYVIVNSPIGDYEEGDVIIPQIWADGELRELHPSYIYYPVLDQCYPSGYTTIMVIDVQDEAAEPAYETLLLGSASTIYVSLNNIYITFTQWEENRQATHIHRFAIADGEVSYRAAGVVPGRLLNQFSMDEHDGYFRVAITTGWLSSSFDDATSKNHLCVMDMDLNIVGKLENLAPGEEIYSARFMGDRCYLVTFRKVDPLFVIDLENPYNPPGSRCIEDYRLFRLPASL